MERLVAWRGFSSCCGGWLLHGAGWWAVDRLDSGETVGFTGAFYRATEPDLEIGWLLYRAFWGHGYAVEAVRGALDHAFDVRRVPRATAIIDHENTRSRRVAERAGFKPVEDTELFGKRVGRWMLAASERLTAAR